MKYGNYMRNQFQCITQFPVFFKLWKGKKYKQCIKKQFLTAMLIYGVQDQIDCQW